MDWKAIDSAPLDGTVILLWLKHGNQKYPVDCARWTEKGWRGNACKGAGFYTASHWAPMPDTPSQ